MTAPLRGKPGTWEYLLHWREDNEIAVDASIAGLPALDIDAAHLTRAEFPGQMHYVRADQRWYLWNGKCHQPDTPGNADKIAAWLADRAAIAVAALKQKIRSDVIHAGGGAADVQAEMKALEPAAKYLASLGKTPGRNAFMSYLAALCVTDVSELDERHPRWLNCANGTVDLQTALIKAHHPDDMLTYCVPVASWAQAQCPMFWNLVWRMAGRNVAVAEYVIRVLGYALIGSNPEHLIFFLNGPTNSGKSVVLEICAKVLGPLAHRSKADLIVLNRYGRNARRENSVRGARLITITETTGWMLIDEGQVKRITGEDIISVDQHYAKEELKTPVTWVIIVATNEMPSITNLDDAMQERVVVIPCGETIPLAERDRRLAEKILASEQEGILSVLIKACREYHRSGLPMPAEVAAETARYRQQQNTVANFIADCCVMAAWDPGASIRMPDAWDVYRTWSRGEIHLGKQAFFDQLERQPGVTRYDDGSTRRVFEGLLWSEQGLRILAEVARQNS